MGGLLGQLNIKLNAETAQFNSAMDKSASRARVTMSRIAGDVRRHGPIIGATLAAAAAGFAFQMKRIIDDADELSKMSRKIGVSVQSLSAFRHAAQLAGTDFETLTKGIGRFSRVASDAQNQLVTAIRPFRSLNIEFEDVEGNLRNVEDLLLDVADRFSKMEDGTKKAALAQELFGRSGVELIPFLNEGRDGIQKIREEAEKLGIVFNDKTARAAENFNDNITRLKAVTDGLLITYSNDLLPILVEVSQQILDNKDKTDGLRESSDFLAGSLITIVSAGKLALRAFDDLGMAVGDLAANFHFLSGGGTLTGAFSGPIINAIRFNKELRAINSKNYRDSTEAWQKTIDEIEMLWANHWKRMDSIAEEGSAAGGTKKTYKSIGDDFRKMMEEGERLAESLRTPLEILADEQERLNELIMAGAIDMETYNRAAAKVIETYDKQTKLAQKNNSIMKELGANFSSQFEDAIVNGSRFREVLQGLEKDIIRILTRRKLLDPFFGALFGTENTGGLFDSIFSEKGNVFHHGNRIAQYFAKGGVISSPMAFPLNGGVGVAGEAGIEAILPLMRTSGGDLGVKAEGVSRTEVNIYAPPGSQVQEERQFDNGIERINIIIDEAVASNISRPGSLTQSALKKSFGVNTRTVTR